VSIIVVKQLLGGFPSGCLTGISGARSRILHVSAIWVEGMVLVA